MHFRGEEGLNLMGTVDCLSCIGRLSEHFERKKRIERKNVLLNLLNAREIVRLVIN